SISAARSTAGKKETLSRWERGSALLRRNVLDARDEGRDLALVVFQVHALGRRRAGRDADPRPPFALRADRPRPEAAAAVRTDVVQVRFNALRTKSALEGADPRRGRLRRQVAIAPLAVGTELERHGGYRAMAAAAVRTCSARSLWRAAARSRTRA